MCVFYVLLRYILYVYGGYYLGISGAKLPSASLLCNVIGECKLLCFSVTAWIEASNRYETIAVQL